MRALFLALFVTLSGACCPALPVVKPQPPQPGCMAQLGPPPPSNPNLPPEAFGECPEPYELCMRREDAAVLRDWLRAREAWVQEAARRCGIPATD